MNKFCASAPGKILWLGGYSVLEKGNVALVTVVNKYVKAEVQPLAGSSLLIEIPQFKLLLKGKIKEGKPVFKAKGAELERAKFVIAAIRNCLKYVDCKHRKQKVCGLKVTTFSDAAFGTGKEKTGLGSSAAVTVACVAAFLSAAGIRTENGQGKRIVHNLSQLSHSEAQGKVGSGFDIAAAVYGSIKYSRYSPQLIGRFSKFGGAKFAKAMESEWDCRVEPIHLPKNYVPVIAFTGVSASTSEMVRKVIDFKAAKPDDYWALMDEINAANSETIASIGKADKFASSFEEGRLLTKKLGELAGAQIESPEATRLIHESLQNGAFVCKLPGAGGGDCIAAICLGSKDAVRLKKFWKSSGLKLLEIGFGVTGVIIAGCK